MGIVKISEEMHEEVRRASQVMVRSINAQAEFWMKIGRLAEQNPTLSFVNIIQQQLLNHDTHTDTQDSSAQVTHLATHSSSANPHE